jgi:hypothetical protein
MKMAKVVVDLKGSLDPEAAKSEDYWPDPPCGVPAQSLNKGRYGWIYVPIDRQPRCDHCGKPVYPSLLTEEFGVCWRHCPETKYDHDGYWSCFIDPPHVATVDGSDKPIS